jgi:two-component system, chemotaxis family, response regulator PixH
MPTILIAEDSPFQMALLRSELESKGFEVVGAQDALQANMMALRTEPDAIVLDVSMPGGSGLEVVKRLRRSIKTSGIPVIIVTADSDPRTREAAISLGASAFFCKPIDLEHLVSNLSQLCSPPDPGTHKKEVPVAAACEKVIVPPSPDMQSSPESVPAALRSWREILQEMTEKHPSIALDPKSSRR